MEDRCEMKLRTVMTDLSPEDYKAEVTSKDIRFFMEQVLRKVLQELLDELRYRVPPNPGPK